MRWLSSSLDAHWRSGCFAAPHLWPRNGCAARAQGKESVLWIPFDPRVVMPPTFNFRRWQFVGLGFSYSNHCCSKKPFTKAWPSARCKYFQKPLIFEHSFQNKAPAFFIFVSEHCDETYLIPSWDQKWFLVHVDCPQWRRLETHLVLHVPTLPVLFY